MRIDRIIANKLFIISLFTSSLIHSQIPVNGFCSFKEFQVKPNQIRISTVDFNNDGWRDFVIFTQTDKNIFLNSWDKNGYSLTSARSSSTSLYDIHIASINDATGKKYAFISRKNREAGFINFGKSGSVSILSRIKFDSYPSSLDAADINKNGRTEVLVSGSNFIGLSIITEDKSKLQQIIIDNENLYSYSGFIDLDYDGYPDIAAIDLIKNSIVFFNNDGLGNFYQSRSIGIKDELKEFRIADLNSDGYTDLIFTSKYGFEYFPGDSVSSFRKRISIKTPEKPDKYTILDFNGDGYNDIAYLNSETGKLFVAFAKSSSEFYPPIVYLERKGIIDLTSFIDRGGRKIAVLDLSGKIYLIEKVNDIDNVSISFAFKQGIIGTFRLSKSKMPGLYVLDNSKTKIHFLLSVKGIFDTYYSFNISGNYTNVIVDEINREVKTFYFFSKGERTIELLRVNFSRLEVSKRILYTSGQIHDLKITSDRLKDLQTIFVLSEKERNLFIETFDFRDFRYRSSGSDLIYSGFEKASLAFGLYKEIFHIVRNGNNLFYKKSLFNRKVQSEETLFTKTFSDNDIVYSDIESFTDELINENLTVCWLSDLKDTDFYLYIKNRLNKITIKDFSPSVGAMKYLDGEDENSLFIFDRNKGKLKRIDISNQGKVLNISDVFDSKNVYSYIVDRLIGNKEFLIYSDDNLVKIKIVK